MTQVEGMTFDEAMRYARQARSFGKVGISVFHRHEYAELEADEGCYVVSSYSPQELAVMRKEAETPEPPLAPFEITHWKWEGDDQIGQQLFVADTLPELLDIAMEQNGTET